MPVPAREKVIGYEPVPPLKPGETRAERSDRETSELAKKRRKAKQ